MAWFAHFLERYPELTLFLTIGVGFAIGSLRIGGFSLGSVTGSLFAGLAIGQLAEVPISDTAKSILFLLFLFETGSLGGLGLEGSGGLVERGLGLFAPVVHDPRFGIS